MRRLTAVLLISLATVACSQDLYESDDFRRADADSGVVLWRLAYGPGGFAGIGGPIHPDDLEEDAGPISLSVYRSAGGRAWDAGPRLGELDTPQLGMTAWEDGFAVSGMWDGLPAVFLSGDGLEWTRLDLPTPQGVRVGLGVEPAGIAASDGTVLVAGFSADSPLLWRIDGSGVATAVEAAVFGSGSRISQIATGPNGFIASVTAASEDADPAPIWTSADGREWNPAAVPFDGTHLGGLVGSPAGYVAVVSADGDGYTLWTSPDGAAWTARADRVTVFDHLVGTSGDLYADLVAPPTGTSDPRPIAFSFNGRWLEFVEAFEGSPFLVVAVASHGTTRVISGFGEGDNPIPLVLVAED